MKNKYTIIFSTVLLLTTSSCALLQNKGYNNSKWQKDKATGIKEALELEFEKTKDPALNIVPKHRLLNAIEYKNELLKKQTRGAINGVNWVELGPNNQAGRSRCVWVDLNDTSGKTVWVGSVGGGLWKTTDITQTNPNWTSNTQFLANISIADIAQDPTNKNIFYLATGEAIKSTSAVNGFGVFKSTDGGLTWNQLASTTSGTFSNCTKAIVTNTGAVLIGTSDGGVQRSTNGGNTFTKVLGTGLSITGAASNFCYDIELAANGNIYASIEGSLHKSINDGASFGAEISVPGNEERIEIACAPSDSNYVYLVVENGGKVDGVYKSTNGATNFTTQTEPADVDGGIPATDFSRGQAWYDLSIAVHPSDKEIIFVGGIDVFKSDNGGLAWQQVSHWYGLTYPYMHADQHDIIFSPFDANTAYFVHDGGIDETKNAQNSNPTIAYKGNNYNTIQFYACAMHPAKGNAYYLAGAQDNGSIQLTKDILSAGFEVTGGDGAFCHIDQDEPQYQFTSYVYNNYRRSVDGGNNFVNINYNNNGRFINPTDYDDVNNKMYCTSNADKYLIWQNPQTGNTFDEKTITLFGNSRASIIKVSPNVPNRVYFGSGIGRLVLVDNASSTTPTGSIIADTSAVEQGFLSSIDIEQGNENHIVITYSSYGVGHVWETTNAGATWTNISGNLPDIPVRSILINPNNSDQLLIATELGVWSTDDVNGAATNWAPSNSGLANVRTDMLQIRSSDKAVIAATHGRGLFRSDIFTDPTAKFEVDQKIGYVGEEFVFTNTSFKNTSNLWDFGDGTVSNAVNPTKKYSTPGVYNVKLIINSGADSIIKKKLITILPSYNAPYLAAMGGNFETNFTDFAADSILGTKWERGNSTITGKDGVVSGSNAWVTGLTSTTYSENSFSNLYSPQIQVGLAGSFYLKFDAKYDLEFEYDGFIIEYTIDSGKTWLPLGTTVVPNWYDFGNSPRVSLVFPTAQAFFNGTQANYNTKLYDVTSLKGKIVAFRFSFRTDEAVQNAGIAIDNFELIGPLFTPLSMNVLSFNATIQNEDALLQWETKNELPNTIYTLEKSKDGISFQIINEQTSSNLPISKYSFVDKQVFAEADKWYYRIKSVVDNKVAYSLINIVQNDEAATELSISPNPFTNKIIIQSKLAINKVIICNTAGQELIKTTATNNVVLVDDALPKGTYFIKVKVGNKWISRKVLK
jgi:PKD repeat protein